MKTLFLVFNLIVIFSTVNCVNVFADNSRFYSQYTYYLNAGTYEYTLTIGNDFSKKNDHRYFYLPLHATEASLTGDYDSQGNVYNYTLTVSGDTLELYDSRTKPAMGWPTLSEILNSTLVFTNYQTDIAMTGEFWDQYGMNYNVVGSGTPGAPRKFSPVINILLLED
jgi:hypothetical protein